jgi:hypothetical protein
MAVLMRTILGSQSGVYGGERSTACLLVSVIPGLQRREVGGCSFCFFSSSGCCFGDLEFCGKHSQLGQ